MTSGSDTPRAVFDFSAGASLLFRRPCHERSARTIDDVGALLQEAERLALEGRWVACFVAYEAAPAFDSALRVRDGAGLPLAWIAAFDEPEAPSSGEPGGGSFTVSEWTSAGEGTSFGSAVRLIREAIARGDVYQVNHTIRMRARFEGDALAFYGALSASQGRGYCAYLDLETRLIISASPELFFRTEGRSVETRPMKGTARRGRWLAEDQARALALRSSEKDRAENVMIVDLIRNDLGRVAVPGSVQVPRLFEVERYRTVLQATSTITATLREGIRLPELFAAMFPCGSVTGAPKVAAMRMIAALEDAPREAYCGAVGLLRPGGDATFNVAIRTVSVDPARGLAEYGVGGGITWDSRAGSEADEVADKAAILTERWPDFELLETMLLENGEFPRLEAHLARLGDSAAYFGFPDPVPAARSELARHAAHHLRAIRRVRLLADAEACVAVESAPLDPLPPGPLPVALAAVPVSARDPFLFHKTTHRRLYDSARAMRPEAFDVLLSNEAGELTELTIGNLVVELEDGRYTPPREAGLLAGIFRAELLLRGEVRERTLTPEDARRARRLWLVNGVRGWVEVALAD